MKSFKSLSLITLLIIGRHIEAAPIHQVATIALPCIGTYLAYKIYQETMPAWKKYVAYAVVGTTTLGLMVYTQFKAESDSLYDQVTQKWMSDLRERTRKDVRIRMAQGHYRWSE